MTTSDSRDLPEPIDGVVARCLGDEYVLYDKETDHAASLTGVSAQVWRAVEGGPPPEAPAEQVSIAVAELTELGFLRAPLSRRNVMRAAVLGGAAASLSGIITISSRQRRSQQPALRPTSQSRGRTYRQ